MCLAPARPRLGSGWQWHTPLSALVAAWRRWTKAITCTCYCSMCTALARKQNTANRIVTLLARRKFMTSRSRILLPSLVFLSIFLLPSSSSAPPSPPSPLRACPASHYSLCPGSSLFPPLHDALSKRGLSRDDSSSSPRLLLCTGDAKLCNTMQCSCMSQYQ